MKLTNYFSPLLKWWWLIFLASIIAAIPPYLFTRSQPPVYMTRTTLVVGRAISDPNPNGNEFILTQQLAQAYAGIAMREPVRDATMKALGMQQLPAYSAYANPNSSFIEIIVSDTDPARAQIVANELARQLILQSPTTPQQQEQERLQFINEQLNSLQSEIVKTQEDIAQKQQELADSIDATQISELSVEIQSFETRLSLLQTNYTTLLSSTQSGALNTLSVIEPASLPTFPIGSRKLLFILMAAASGFILAAGAAYLLEFLDRTLKTAEQIDRLVQLPVIGYIGNAGQNGWKHVAENPRSLISEAFRSLRTSLEFSGVDKPLKTILVTSPDAGDGKTLVAANLALVLSKTEKKVILLDCDLRNPNIHRALGIKSRPGLAEVFLELSPILDTIHNLYVQNLSVIPAGSVPPNPAELLGSNRMKLILGALSEIYDIIIIDCTPLMTPDALILSAQVDGVVLVTRHAHTTENSIQKASEQLKLANARILGVILNRIPRSNFSAYGYFNKGYYGQAKENQAVNTGMFNGHLNKEKIIPNILNTIKKSFHRNRRETEVDLISDDYLFTKAFSSQEQKGASPTNPSDKSLRD